MDLEQFTNFLAGTEYEMPKDVTGWLFKAHSGNHYHAAATGEETAGHHHRQLDFTGFLFIMQLLALCNQEDITVPDVDDSISLADDLYERMVKSNFTDEEKVYWSKDVVDQLIQEHVVRRELAGARKKYKEKLIEFILHHAKKLFAMAVLADSGHGKILKMMEFFETHGFQDSNLSAEIDIRSIGSQQRSHPCLQMEHLTSLDDKLWRAAILRRICEVQWQILVPVLSTAKINYDFERKTILPFTKVAVDRGNLYGPFSRVYKVKIQSGHFEDQTRPKSEWPEYFAVKEIIPPDAEERQKIAYSWANEATTLKNMNDRHKDHVVRFITAFTKGDIGTARSYYLIFEWANGGSLEDLFAWEPNPILSKRLLKLAAIQLRGLAEALQATHDEAQIRHGDLKPRNILRFEPTGGNIFGTLKLGDCSMATVLRQKVGLDITTEYGTPLYEPPEVELGELKLLSRQYDIWSMGCVILEIIIWLLYGYRGVQRFRADVNGQSRDRVTCYDIEMEDDRYKAKVRPIVIQWMDHLAKEPLCGEDTALGAFLRLVRKRLLIVELPPEMGQTKYVQEWEVPMRQEPSMPSPKSPGTPQLMATSTTSREEHFSPRQIQPYRATSKELVDRLNEEVMDDEDRPEDFWFKAGTRPQQPEFRLSAPRAMQNASGHLMAAGAT
ncbi:Serine/threonine-protein kinase par-4 [Pleurostoma richardsiae]|uniref:Serine/threonine-protein kinase par-4 n=1 Tax=Pleurostoma richardsiae TaxID=41990 RepID=A0AA38R602_9PEZI|nr:Serine/threonine-protein kinase par-4 [Pleurostoma richardsiae]